MTQQPFFVYIMTNFGQTTLYVGVTNDLHRRVYEHKQKLIEGFTKKYSLTYLVYYETFDSIEQAIMREKQIKAGSRKKTTELVKQLNANWEDLYETL